ncbi:MAG: NTP transferase domain-containing protein [Rhodospirillaceae bacterium]|nr:NTP transferase domain-containing protein [Rhodospirillaceae bacterium]
MKFGDIPVGQATGAILAHSLRVGDETFKKGRTLSDSDVSALVAAGFQSVMGVQLESGDIDENTAAARIAASVAGESVTLTTARTGRCNITATERGVVVLDPEGIDSLNLIDESVTLSTIAPFTAVEAGDMVATVKIITFGVAEAVIAQCETAAQASAPLVRVASYGPKKIGLIQTILPVLRQKVIDKATSVTRARVAALGGSLIDDIHCGHKAEDVAASLKKLQSAECDIALVLGASAIADRRDVIPAAVEQCGGTVEHLGMPVDPGNLMMLATMGKMHVLGIPGSARSPRLHGFDWVLQRLVADIPVSGTDLMRMGVGGLLKEIPSRPMPRARITAGEERSAETGSFNIGAIILAAGQSRRMGNINKLLAEIDGKPMLSYVVEAALASDASPVIVVTGHEPERIEAALKGHPVTFIHNPDYAEGLSTSLRHGLSMLDPVIDGAVVCLGDMPGISPSHIDQLIDAFDPDDGHAICVPTFKGKRGNPVLWHRRFFSAMSEVSGDVGARHLIGDNEELLLEIPMDDNAILADLDTPEALAAHKAARER